MCPAVALLRCWVCSQEAQQTSGITGLWQTQAPGRGLFQADPGARPLGVCPLWFLVQESVPYGSWSRSPSPVDAGPVGSPRHQSNSLPCRSWASLQACPLGMVPPACMITLMQLA